MPLTILTICTDAAQEIGVLGQGEVLSGADGDTFLRLLCRILNAWNADRRTVYATAFQSYTLVPNLSPTLIGPSGQFVVSQRPVAIEAARLTPSVPPVNIPITMRDAQWWAGQSTPTLTSTYPTDLYYQPEWPNGKLFFWPVPTAAYSVQLQTRVVLDDTVALSDAFDFPPGYQDALTLTLAERAQRPFGKPPDPMLLRDASFARMVIFENNDVPPRLETRDSGMQASHRSGTRADFNWLDGSISRR
jgi:hypothetical protein